MSMIFVPGEIEEFEEPEEITVENPFLEWVASGVAVIVGGDILLWTLVNSNHHHLGNTGLTLLVLVGGFCFAGGAIAIIEWLRKK